MPFRRYYLLQMKTSSIPIEEGRIRIRHSAVASFHLNVAPIGRDEGAAIVAAYALLTVVPALWKLHDYGE